MPYVRDVGGTSLATLQDIAPSSAEQFSAAVGETWQGNPTVLGVEATEVALANRNGARLSAYDAGQIATAAGMRDFAPGEGQYSREALDMVIERKRQERIRQDVIGRTPYSLTGTPLRGLGMLGATLLDPLNIASAFVPVVGEARYAALLAGAGGAAGRAGIRLAVGAAEGAVGTALLEPVVAGAHAYLGDDYTMRDSLINIGVGSLFGGGLHVVGGAAVDALLPGRWDRPRALSDLEGHEAGVPPRRSEQPAPGSAADIAARSTPETRQEALRTSVSHLVEGKVPEVDGLYRQSPAVDRSVIPPNTSQEALRGLEALRSVMDQHTDVVAALRHRELGDVSLYWGDENGGIAHIIARRAAADGESPRQIAETLAGVIRAAADGEIMRAYTATGVPLERGRVDLALGDYIAVLSREKHGQQENWVLTGFKKRSDDTSGSLNPKATHAVAPGIQQQVGAELQQILGPQRPLVNPAELRATAARQASPEASITADFPAAKAADQRLAAAPKSEDLKAAEAEMTAATDRLNALTDNLVASGGDPKLAAKITEALAPFDEAIKDAGKLGDAVKAAAICGLRQ